MKKKIKIFLGFREFANQYRLLERGFNKIHIKAKFYDLQPQFFYEQKKCYYFDIIRLLNKKRSVSYNKSIFKKALWLLLHHIFVLPIFIYVLLKYNVFIFSNAESFFYNYFDYYIIKLFKKKLLCVFHGGESRPPYVCGISYAKYGDNVEDYVKITKIKKSKIIKIEKYADFIINAHTMSQFNTTTCIHLHALGFPFEQKNINIAIKKNDNNTIKIIHCPSSPEWKGTNEIRLIINDIIKSGYNITYEEYSKVPNKVILEKIASCDIVVDQMYSDFAYTGLALEASALGKPCILGGYAYDQWENLQHFLPGTIYVHPSKIKEAIILLITDKNYREQVGQKAKHFVENYLSEIKVAERYLKVINNNYPKDWEYNPNECFYIKGVGNNEEKFRVIVKTMIEKYGINSLQIYDKPKLQNCYIKFAYKEL